MISSQVSQLSFVGNGSTSTPYALANLRFDENAWLVVEELDEDDGVTVLTHGSHYTITGNGASSSASVVTGGRAIPATSRLRISRNTPRVQTSSLIATGEIPSAVIEKRLDWMVMGLIDAKRRGDATDGRALMAPDGELLANLPSLAERKGMVLLFHPTTGDPMLMAPGTFPAGPEGSTDSYLDAVAYGATRDGVDCSAAMLSAANAASIHPTAKTVRLRMNDDGSQPTYKYSIEVPDGVNFEGPRGTNITQDGNCVRCVPANGSHCLCFSSLSNQFVKRLAFIGEGIGETAALIKVGSKAPGVQYPGWGLEVEDCYFEGADKGIHLIAAIQVEINNCIGVNCTDIIYCEPNGLTPFPQLCSTIQINNGAYGATVDGDLDPLYDVNLFYFDRVRGPIIQGVEAGNCRRFVTATGTSVTVIGGNCESFHGDEIIDLDGGQLTWIGTELECTAGNPEAAFVNNKNSDAGVTLIGLKFNGFTNYGTTGAPLGVRTYSVTNYGNVQIHGGQKLAHAVYGDADFTEPSYDAYVQSHPVKIIEAVLGANQVITAVGAPVVLTSPLKLTLPAGFGIFRYRITGKIQLSGNATVGTRYALHYSGDWPQEKTGIKYGKLSGGTTTEKDLGVIQRSSNAFINGNSPGLITHAGGGGSAAESYWIEIDATISGHTGGVLEFRASKDTAGAETLFAIKGSDLRAELLPN